MSNFNRFTYEVQIHSFDDNYCLFLFANKTEEEVKKAVKDIIHLMPNSHRIDIKNLKTSVTKYVNPKFINK